MIERKIKTMRKAYLLLVTILFAMSVWAESPMVGSGRYDQQIQQEVTRLLDSKDKWKGMTASTDDGIVTLQGTSNLLLDKLDAAKKNQETGTPAGRAQSGGSYKERCESAGAGE